MTKNDIVQIAILKLRDAISSKEMVGIRASRDLNEFGKWMCDYDSWVTEIQSEIDEYKKELNSLI